MSETTLDTLAAAYVAAQRTMQEVEQYVADLPTNRPENLNVHLDLPWNNQAPGHRHIRRYIRAYIDNRILTLVLEARDAAAAELARSRAELVTYAKGLPVPEGQ